MPGEEFWRLGIHLTQVTPRSCSVGPGGASYPRRPIGDDSSLALRARRLATDYGLFALALARRGCPDCPSDVRRLKRELELGAQSSGSRCARWRAANLLMHRPASIASSSDIAKCTLRLWFRATARDGCHHRRRYDAGQSLLDLQRVRSPTSGQLPTTLPGLDRLHEDEASKLVRPRRSGRAACGCSPARCLSLPRRLQSTLYARSDRPITSFFFSAPVGLIDLDEARQSLPPRAHHRSPQLVHPSQAVW